MQTEICAPPFMDVLFIPLSDEDPVRLIGGVVLAAQVLDRVAAAFGSVIQYGPGKTEAAIVFRWAGKTEAQKHRNGEQHDCVPRLPTGRNRFLRVVNGYKHLGAIASAALRFAPEVSAKINAASAIEKSLAKLNSAPVSASQVSASKCGYGNSLFAFVCRRYLA